MSLRTTIQLITIGFLSLPLFAACVIEETETADKNSNNETVSGLDDGQSGSEGSQLRMPCFFEEQSLFRVKVLSETGGCFEGEILELVSPGAHSSSFSVGDTVGGTMDVFYNSRTVQKDDIVTIQYVEGQMGENQPLSGYVQVSPMNGEKVEVEWLGGTYEYTSEELLADSCTENFKQLPNLIVEDDSGVDPDDGKAPVEAPLSCP